MSAAELYFPGAGGGTPMVPADQNPCQAWNEVASPLGASATYTGASRDNGSVTGTPSRFGSFNAYALADQAGTMRIEGSWNNSTWFRMTPDQALAANTALILTVPVLFRYHRVVVVNGATPQGSLQSCTSYTA